MLSQFCLVSSHSILRYLAWKLAALSLKYLFQFLSKLFFKFVEIQKDVKFVKFMFSLILTSMRFTFATNTPRTTNCKYSLTCTFSHHSLRILNEAHFYSNLALVTLSSQICWWISAGLIFLTFSITVFISQSAYIFNWLVHLKFLRLQVTTSVSFRIVTSVT